MFWANILIGKNIVKHTVIALIFFIFILFFYVLFSAIIVVLAILSEYSI